jgi:LuxR family maltose regulon positive regulatory protein
VSYAQLFLITGDDAKAQRLATAALWAPDVVVRDRTDVLMIKAAASWRLGEREKAVEAFRQSVKLSEQIHSAHAYLIIAEGDLRALAAAAGFSLPRPIEERLAERGGIFPVEASFIALSPRELEVLARMQDHRTVAEIGRSLHLSVNTVKKHLAAINAKLGVHDRRAALAQARRLGLLDPVDDDASGAAARRADAPKLSDSPEAAAS